MLIATRRVYKTNERPAVTIGRSNARVHLDALRDLAERNPLSENLNAIHELEKSIKKSELYANWLNHPISKEIIMALIRQIEFINGELLAGHKVNSKHLIRREEWRAMLNLFDPRRASGDSLTRHIDAKIEEFRRYYDEI